MNLTRSQKHIFLKLAEELNELSVELLQAVNKPNKNNWGKICHEISDVENYINKIKKLKKC
jgi:hypothetical protein